MKRLHQLLAAILCALTLLFVGCAEGAEEPTTESTLQEYRATITALEEALSKAKEEQERLALDYQSRITSLEEKLAQLNAKEDLPLGEERVEFRYRVENGSAIITGYRGECALLTVPQTLDGYPVIAIGERAFEGATFSAVILQEGVSSIGWFAFYGCENLINVTLPESVSSIGYAVFDGCGDLTVYCNADSYAARYAQSYGLTLITT